MKKVLLINDKDPIDTSVFLPREDEYYLSVYQYPHGTFDLNDALKRNADTQVLITPYMDLSADRLKMLPQLEAIITLSTAIEFIDRTYCEQHSIRVINNSGYSGSAVAEHAFGLILALTRHLTALDKQTRAGSFMDFRRQGTELDGKCLGIVGFGHIGQKLAKMAMGFNMNVVYLNRSLRQYSEGVRAVSKTELFTTADVIALTLPLTRETRYLVDAEVLKEMKDSAMIVSISPDDVINLDDLKLALLDGSIAGAALDLHSNRPDLYSLDDLIVTPTRAYYTKECVQRRDHHCLQNLRNMLN